MGRSRVSEADPLGKAKRGRPPSKPKETQIKTGFDGRLQAPWRKTVSIFKQPVTLVHSSSRECKKPTVDQLKRGSKRSQEKPVQFFWARQFDGIQASVPIVTADKLASHKPEYQTDSLQLGGRLERITDLLGERATAAALCSSIHNPNAISVLGQRIDKKLVEANPFTALACDQPPIVACAVTSDDISGQEKRVLDARKRLQEVYKHFG